MTFSLVRKNLNPIHNPFLPGLDPAGPTYGDDEMPAFRRLDKTDAKYVDIIHSSHPLLGKDF